MFDKIYLKTCNQCCCNNHINSRNKTESEIRILIDQAYSRGRFDGMKQEYESNRYLPRTMKEEGVLKDFKSLLEISDEFRKKYSL